MQAHLSFDYQLSINPWILIIAVPSDVSFWGTQYIVKLNSSNLNFTFVVWATMLLVLTCSLFEMIRFSKSLSFMMQILFMVVYINPIPIMDKSCETFQKFYDIEMESMSTNDNLF